VRNISVAIYLPPQTNACTKIALNELYKAISKQENAHPEAAFLVARDFNAGKLKSLYLISTSMSHVQPEGKQLLTTFPPHKETGAKL
jgi:hypothetical protein